MREFIEATTPYKVREIADNDVSVIHEATENHCDVILLNLRMPLQDSLVTAALLRGKLPHVKIVGFSASSVDLGNRVPPEIGFDAVLTNQDGLSQLVATLKALMPEAPRE